MQQSPIAQSWVARSPVPATFSANCTFVKSARFMLSPKKPPPLLWTLLPVTLLSTTFSVFGVSCEQRRDVLFKHMAVLSSNSNCVALNAAA